MHYLTWIWILLSALLACEAHGVSATDLDCHSEVAAQALPPHLASISNQARKAYQKMHREAKARLDQVLLEVSENPFEGEFKLKFGHDLRFAKFHAAGTQYRIAYSITAAGGIVLQAVGPRQKFYESIRHLER